MGITFGYALEKHNGYWQSRNFWGEVILEAWREAGSLSLYPHSIDHADAAMAEALGWAMSLPDLEDARDVKCAASSWYICEGKSQTWAKVARLLCSHSSGACIPKPCDPTEKHLLSCHDCDHLGPMLAGASMTTSLA